MKTKICLAMVISLSAPFGNGQDDGVSSLNGGAIQGNAMWSKLQYEAELEKAAQAARQKKALLESMASVAPQPPRIMTAEQFLQVHRPPTPPPGERDSATNSPVRRDAYVPEFQTVPARSPRVEEAAPEPNPSVTNSSAPEPEISSESGEKKGLFARLRGKEKGKSGFGSRRESKIQEPSVPASSYPEASMVSEEEGASRPAATPSEPPTPPVAAAAPEVSLPPPPPTPSLEESLPPPAPAPQTAHESIPAMDAEPSGSQGAGAFGASRAGSESETKPSLLGRLFSKEKTTQPSSLDEQTGSSPSAVETSVTSPVDQKTEKVAETGAALPGNKPEPTPANPTSANPTPANPTPANPTPANPTPANPTPANPTPANPTPALSPTASPSVGGEANIFQRAPNSGAARSGGETSTVLMTSQATVNGVLVKLFEGDQVTVLERSGTMVRVRLPDQREGLMPANALSR